MICLRRLEILSILCFLSKIVKEKRSKQQNSSKLFGT